MENNAGAGLSGWDAVSVFATDQEPERVSFSIGGNEAWVELKPMDAAATNRFTGLAARIFDTAGQVRTDADPEAIAGMQTYLVGRTLVDWCLWRRQRLKEGGLGDWQQDRAGETEPDRRRQLEGMQATPAFWNRLVAECMRVNGLDGESQGN